MLYRLIRNGYVVRRDISLYLNDTFNLYSVHRRLFSNKIQHYLSAFPNVHSQRECEQFWSDIWHESGLFSDKPTEQKEHFRLLLPPPNITGSLHLGHSLTATIQDALCRYHRMNGKNVTWYGGTDHAGIATQIVIEKLLWSKQNKTRHDVSREEFAELFEEWKHKRIEEIQHQLRSLGVSIDFKSDYFTLSSEMSRIVTSAFIELFNRGLIYRSSYMVNWSYYLQSTLSDIEIEHKYISGPTMFQVPGCDEKFLLGVLHYFKYPLVDSDEFVTIATTRIESLMGDVALCVNLTDARHNHLVGRYALNPFTNEKMPILADETVKPDFGTGVLKLTPAHSAIDYEIASRHQLPSISIFNDLGRIDCAYEQFNGMHRYAAKEVVKCELERLGLYCGYKDHGHWLPVCSRSGDIIESRLVPQWFLRCDDARYQAEFVANRDNLSEQSQQRWSQLREKLHQQDRSMAIIPSSYRNTWKDWFSRYKDWCISRQIYWGHRIPAYQIYHNSSPTDLWVAANSKEEACRIAKEKHGLSGEIELKQDQDVLDTWFSSGLLPLAVTGWFDGNTTRDAPLSLMETGHDIIFFWVARMTILSLLLANKLPFPRVLLHGMICDESGKKMSKSKANVVDPMHVIHGASMDALIQQNKDYLDSGLISEEKFTRVLSHTIKAWPKGIPVCGADILRLSLLQADFKDQQVKFELQKTVKKRVFANKMHQSIRFILLNLSDEFERLTFEPDQLSHVDKWILTKLAQLINLCRQTFITYDLHEAARQVERFWIHDLCDIYLEQVKNDILMRNESYLRSMNMLISVVEQALHVIHPLMPFITENLYQHLEFALAKQSQTEFTYQSLLEREYPDVKQDPLLRHFDQTYMVDMERAIAIIRKVRWFRHNFFINREPLIDCIRVASLSETLPQMQQTIESFLKMDPCRFEFVNLYDIYSYDDCYCTKLDLELEASDSSSSDSEGDSQNRPNSLQSDEIYLLFSVDKEKLNIRLNESKLKLKPDKINALLCEFDQIHISRFTENYKRATKIVS